MATTASDLVLLWRPRDEFVKLFMPGGVFRILIDYATAARYPVEFDIWTDGRAGMQRASIYCGLTRVLDIYCDGKRVRMDAAAAVLDRLGRARTPFPWVLVAEAGILVPAIVEFLDAAIPEASTRRGAVGAAMMSVPGRTTLARDFGLRARTDAVRTAIAGARESVTSALEPVPFVQRPLTEQLVVDSLCVEADGRIVLIEAEARRGAEVSQAPIHGVLMLALWRLWLESDPSAMSTLRDIGVIRQQLGLGTTPEIVEESHATYLLCVEAGVSETLVERMRGIWSALGGAGIEGADRFRCEVTSLAGRTVPIGTV